MQRVGLPVVEYAEIDPLALVPPSVDDLAVVPFGFNNGSVWSGGEPNRNGESGDEGYIRYHRKSIQVYLRSWLAKATSNSAVSGRSTQHPSRLARLS